MLGPSAESPAARRRWLRNGAAALAVVACVAVGTTLGAGGYTFYYGEGFSYLSSDPRTCVNCHVMRDHYATWQLAGHHAVATCNDCHTPHTFLGKWFVKSENGFWHSYGFTLQNYHEPIMIRPGNSRVLENNCIDCHRPMVEPIIGVPPDPPGGWNCIHCHADVGHGTPR
jgi:cytochrome c nitrite reductase small subunit